MLVLPHVKAAKGDRVADGIIQARCPHRRVVLTLTVSNGRELAFHQRIARELQAQFYYACPCAAPTKMATDLSGSTSCNDLHVTKSMKNLSREIQMKLNAHTRRPPTSQFLLDFSRHQVLRLKPECTMQTAASTLANT